MAVLISTLTSSKTSNASWHNFRIDELQTETADFNFGRRDSDCFREIRSLALARPKLIFADILSMSYTSPKSSRISLHWFLLLYNSSTPSCLTFISPDTQSGLTSQPFINLPPIGVFVRSITLNNEPSFWCVLAVLTSSRLCCVEWSRIRQFWLEYFSILLMCGREVFCVSLR